eukprot:98544-Amphidinium_carterae.1
MPAPGIGGITGSCCVEKDRDIEICKRFAESKQKFGGGSTHASYDGRALRSLSSSDADEYPTATWKAEYRVGDLSEQVAHGLSQAVADAGARNALCGGVAYNPFQ